MRGIQIYDDSVYRGLTVFVDGWMDGWMDGWTDGWMDGWMDGWVDGGWMGV